jgi:hypothetical protein
MDTTYDVRIWRIQPNARAGGKTYTVRWKVAKQRWKRTFKTAALADSFRSDLLAAACKGEAFDISTGGRSPCSGPAGTCPGTGSPARSPT